MDVRRATLADAGRIAELLRAAFAEGPVWLAAERGRMVGTVGVVARDDGIYPYESLGFRRTGEPPHDLFGTPLVAMAKEVRR